MKTTGELESIWPPRLGDHYQPEKILARGGFGVVVLATERGTRQRVAIKLLNREHGDDPQVELRFLQEANIVAGLTHPHVLTLLDFGIERDQPYMVLPFIEGASLRERMRSGPLDWRSVTTLARDLASGLAAIHAAQVIHRDLKPENVLVDERGRPLITDFGISKAGSSGVRTAAGVILGTPGYIAPEALLEQPATTQSDMYALGVTLYELLSGHRPLQRADPDDPVSTRTRMEEMLAMRDNVPPPIGSRVHDLPRWLGALVAELLATDPEERPTAAMVAEDLAVRLRPRSVEDTVRGVLLPA